LLPADGAGAKRGFEITGWEAIVLQITEQQVRELLPMGECVARMRECFTALGARGKR
jgi:hypothetical protein